ncbi:MAG: AAA family ATPase [Candidatus Paceibacterota bacterium]
MSQSDESFETLRQSLKSILPGSYELLRADRALVLEMSADVAAFSVFNGHVEEEFDAAYREFKELYREHHADWDKRTLSFVLCRVSENADDDRFYAEREHDPLFCRKYVIHAHEDVGQQRKELLRLPFLPFPDENILDLPRPQSAQDLLQSAGVSTSLSRKLVEPMRRAPDGIVDDLLNGKELLAELVRRPLAAGATPVKPRMASRLTEATIESFRAYRKPQAFNLDASVVVLYGPNGLGKTSFFDAIDYACTGRIGRLCRQRKFNQEDFSRVATYLDDTPGTGSVVLSGTSHSNDSNPSDWVLRRGTGNWSTAWINGEKSDRIGTLTFLTNAEWGEAKPRQQNVENLFRATHLFGQDEQELLIEFRKSSILPETFVSEMLALQDYSHGLGKSKHVSQILATKKTALRT